LNLLYLIGIRQRVSVAPLVSLIVARVSERETQPTGDGRNKQRNRETLNLSLLLKPTGGGDDDV
jgi:hypothetical protein